MLIEEIPVLIKQQRPSNDSKGNKKLKNRVTQEVDEDAFKNDDK